MEIISRKYGSSKNHVRFVILKCEIQERDIKINNIIDWKVKKKWEFEFIKYELQDHCLIRFKGLEDSVFLIKLLTHSNHDIYDHLFKHDSDEYLRYMILFHLTKLFKNRESFPQYIKDAATFEKYIQVAEV